ncbi:MAG TPA: MarR family transcriptional regulator [Steroidobacter sp.]
MDLKEEFARELGRVSRRWRTRVDERLAKTGLTSARWTTLLQLSRSNEPLSQKDLAARVGIEGPTLVRLLDALEEQGLIERQPSAQDRRVKIVRLTRAARPVLNQIERIAREVREEVLGAVRSSDLKMCTAVLRAIGDRLEKTSDVDR